MFTFTGISTDETKNHKGQISEQYDQSGKTTFTAYDFKGNVLSLEKQLCQDYQNVIDWDNSPTLETETFDQEFTYDAMNRPNEITKPDSSVEQYGYNKAALLQTVKAQLRGSSTWTDFITNINYNEKGQRSEIYYDNGSKTSYTYDTETFRLTRLLTTRNTGSDILQDINYTYDPEGNITEIEDDAQQTFYFSNSVVEPNGKYYYDALYRLTKAKGRELSALAMPTDTDFVNNLAVPNTASNAMQNYIQHYVYDELGNIEQMASQGQWTRDYYYNTGVNTLKGHTSGTTEYTYDSHGNTLSMPHLTSMAWDYKDQLDEVDLGGGGTLYNIYDAGCQRVRKVVVKTGGIVEQRVYFSGWEIYRKSISGTIDFERCYLRISDDRKAIAEVETKTIENGNTISSPTSNIRFQYDNHLGSSCLELDTNAAIISYEEYHPFGSTSYRSGITQTEVSLKRYKYVGKERDEETGLYYYGVRYYAAWIGRFVSVDPMAEKFPLYSSYAYGMDNPLKFSDPTGEQSENTVDPTKLPNAEPNQKINPIDASLGNQIQRDNTNIQLPDSNAFNNMLNQEGKINSYSIDSYGYDFSELYPQSNEQASVIADNTSVAILKFNYEIAKPIQFPQPLGNIDPEQLPQTFIGPYNPMEWSKEFLDQNRVHWNIEHMKQEATQSLKQMHPVSFGGPGIGIGAVPALYEGMKQMPFMMFEGLLLTRFNQFNYKQFSQITKGMFSGPKHNWNRGYFYRVSNRSINLYNRSNEILEPSINLMFKAKDIEILYNRITLQDTIN